MLEALLSGKLIKAPELKKGQSGKHYCQFLLSVPTGDDKPTIVSGVAFQETAEKIAKLQKGDALSVVGTLKPSEWLCKTSGNLKQGLSVTANASLSVYDIKKRKPKADAANHDANGFNANSSNHSRYDSKPFDDRIPF